MFKRQRQMVLVPVVNMYNHLRRVVKATRMEADRWRCLSRVDANAGATVFAVASQSAREKFFIKANVPLEETNGISRTFSLMGTNSSRTYFAFFLTIDRQFFVTCRRRRMNRATAAAMNSTAPIVASPATQATLFSSNYCCWRRCCSPHVQKNNC